MVFVTPAGESIAIAERREDVPKSTEYYILYPIGVFGIVALGERGTLSKDKSKRVKKLLAMGLLHKT